MTQILKAAPLIQEKKEILRKQVKGLLQNGPNIHLSIVLVGQNPGSVIYTRNKKKLAEEIGAHCEIIEMSDTVAVEEFTDKIKRLNEDPKVNGILIQLPLPKQLSHLDIPTLVLPEKDVDGFHPVNVGRIASGKLLSNTLVPCTPKGIINLLDFYQLEYRGKTAVIVGRSSIVGRPLHSLLLNRDMTVTICHSKTPNLIQHTKQADFIFMAIGKAKFLTTSYIGTNRPVIIDVGINSLGNNKVCGDVDYKNVRPLCSAITPVPGGIGPLTILSLAENLITSYAIQNEVPIPSL